MSKSELSSSERTLRARAAAHRLHASRDSREITAPARKAFLDRFEREADPRNELPVEERQRRAEHLRKAYFTELALRSVKARRERKGRR